MSIKVNEFVIQADIKEEEPISAQDRKGMRSMKKEIIQECLDAVREMLRRESDR